MKFEIKDQAQFDYAFNNGGQLEPGGESVELTDMLTTGNASVFLPQTITNIVKQAQEPMLVGTSLLRRIQMKHGEQISFGVVGAVQAADIAEGQEYPEVDLQVGSGSVIANVGKSGIAVRITEEMIMRSRYDLMRMAIEEAGRGLARHKEEKIFNMIRSSGVPVMDNLTPSASILGSTSGRDLAGDANGSMTMDDLFDGWAHLAMTGYRANTLLCHPLHWVSFLKDPIMRAIMLATGNGSWFAGWSGDPATRAPWEGSSMGGLGMASGQNIMPAGNAMGQSATALEGYSQVMSAAPVLPGYSNLPLRIIVSPLVPFDPTMQVGDMFLFDSNYLGALVVEHDVVLDEFDDPARDIKHLKMKERYGLATLEEGMAIAVFKNVATTANRVTDVPRATIADLTEIDRTVSPL